MSFTKTHSFCSSSSRSRLACWSTKLLRHLYCASRGCGQLGLLAVDFTANTQLRVSVSSIFPGYLHYKHCTTIIKILGHSWNITSKTLFCFPSISILQQMTCLNLTMYYYDIRRCIEMNIQCHTNETSTTPTATDHLAAPFEFTWQY